MLNALFNGLPDDHPGLLFKGGTSLSKAFGLIHRFSEDVDLVDRREVDWLFSGAPCHEFLPDGLPGTNGHIDVFAHPCNHQRPRGGLAGENAGGALHDRCRIGGAGIP